MRRLFSTELGSQSRAGGGVEEVWIDEETVSAKSQEGIYDGLLLSGKLKEHLLMIQEQAEERFDLLVGQIAEKEGVTERMKREDQMLWVRRMKGIRVRAEEIVREEIIYIL